VFREPLQNCAQISNFCSSCASIYAWIFHFYRLAPAVDSLVWNHGQLLAINDCMYRTMNTFQFVAFNDVDEYIVPVSQYLNWSSVISLADSTNVMTSLYQSPYAYSFQSAFFDPMASTDSASSQEFVDYTLESDIRTSDFSDVRTKVSIALLFSY
jgi:hypothetical protein